VQASLGVDGHMRRGGGVEMSDVRKNQAEVRV